MTNYRKKEGIWEDFFNFKLPDLIYSRKESGGLVHSVDYPPDKEFNLPMCILEISLYNPMAYNNRKVFKAKIWFDKDKRTKKLRPEDYFKYSEYSLELREVLRNIGAEIKIITLADRTTIIKTKNPSDYPSDITFHYLENKIAQIIPYMENWLLEHLKEEKVYINEYITLELKESLCYVYCKGKYFWTFIQDDIKRPMPKEIKKSYDEWFKNDYLPIADNQFTPKNLEFSEVCRYFYKWNDNNLKNCNFDWHFYGHLMHKLYDAGHQDAKKIYDNEIKKRDQINFQLSIKKEDVQITQKGIWNDFFDFKIPEQELRALEYETSSWMQFSHDTRNMIPRSILEIIIYKVEKPSDLWLEVKWYLERNDEIREIEYENSTYFKYWEFLSKKEEILRNLGEDVKMTATLEGTTLISFRNPKFIPKEKFFPEFKKKVNYVLSNLKYKNYSNK